jgi:hypothetical protein
MSHVSKTFSHVVHVVPTSDTFTVEEWCALQWLRARHQQSADLLTERELAHLRFLRWLAQSGLLVEDGGPTAAEGDARTTVP